MASPASIVGVLGTQAPGDLMIPDTTQKVALGTKIAFLDPYYGLQEMVYAKAAAAQETGSLVFFDNTWTATDIPNTAGLGYPIAVAKAAMPAINTYGWYITHGLAPWSASASVAAGVVFGITAAGQVGAVAAGKQVLGARVILASTATFTRTVTTRAGSPVMRATSTDGMFVGLVPSGTGIAAGTITAIDPDGVTFTDSANATATGTVTATFTYTGFIVVYSNAPFGQGQIV